MNNLCQELYMDKKDVCAFFQELRMLDSLDDSPNTSYSEIMNELLDNYNISKLDIRRLYRFLDKNVKKSQNIDDDAEEILDE